MWTSQNRGRYDRSKLRYPSDLSDDEWGLVEPLIPPGKTGGGKRTVVMREVVNGLMYILSTGCQWRAIPKGPVAELVGIEGGVVSGVINLESPGVEASGRRPRHEECYQQA